jgi:hypothetical protein
LLFYPLCDACCCFIRCAMFLVVSSAVLPCRWSSQWMCSPVSVQGSLRQIS